MYAIVGGIRQAIPVHRHGASYQATFRAWVSVTKVKYLTLVHVPLNVLWWFNCMKGLSVSLRWLILVSTASHGQWLHMESHRARSKVARLMLRNQDMRWNSWYSLFHFEHIVLSFSLFGVVHTWWFQTYMAVVSDLCYVFLYILYHVLSTFIIVS